MGNKEKRESAKAFNRLKHLARRDAEMMKEISMAERYLVELRRKIADHKRNADMFCKEVESAKAQWNVAKQEAAEHRLALEQCEQKYDQLAQASEQLGEQMMEMREEMERVDEEKYGEKCRTDYTNQGIKKVSTWFNVLRREMPLPPMPIYMTGPEDSTELGDPVELAVFDLFDFFDKGPDRVSVGTIGMFVVMAAFLGKSVGFAGLAKRGIKEMLSPADYEKWEKEREKIIRWYRKGVRAESLSAEAESRARGDKIESGDKWLAKDQATKPVGLFEDHF